MIISLRHFIETVKPSFDDKALSYLAAVLYDEYIQTGDQSYDFEMMIMFVAYNWYGKDKTKAIQWIREQYHKL